MLTLYSIKQHVAAMCGDSSGIESLLWARLTDYVNWGIRDVEQRARRHCPSKPFCYREYTIDTSVLGTGGDYALPLDFKASLPNWGVRGSTDGGDTFYKCEGVNLVAFQKAITLQPRDRWLFTLHGKTPAQRIQIYPTPLPDSCVITVAYDASQPTLVADSDPITVFPEEDGWEVVLIYAAARHAHRYHQGAIPVDPSPEYERYLAERLLALNADQPNDAVPVHIDETAKTFMDYERFYMGGR